MNLKRFFNTPTHEPFRDKKAERNLFARRTLVAFLGILLLTGVLFANIYQLQIVNFDTYQRVLMVTELNYYLYLQREA